MKKYFIGLIFLVICITYSSAVSCPDFGISTAEQLGQMLECNETIDTTGMHFYLKNNIDARGITFKPRSNPFKGTFDGKRYAISNFHDNRPLFYALAKGGEIGFLTLKRFQIISLAGDNKQFVATLVGIQFGGLIMDIFVDKDTVVSQVANNPSKNGGIVGWQQAGRLVRSGFSGNFEIRGNNPNSNGGVVGISAGALEGVFFNGTLKISGDNPSRNGGIVGFSSGIIMTGIFDGVLEFFGNNPKENGALAGVTINNVIKCKTRGSLIVGDSTLKSGNNALAIGGLVGQQSGGIIEYSSSLINITVHGDNAKKVGGLVGEQRGGGVEYSSFQGKMIAKGNTNWWWGGLVGIMLNMGGSKGVYVKDSFSGGSIELQGTGYEIGGLVGEHMGDLIQTSYSITYITNSNIVSNNNYSDYIGGLVGKSFGKIKNCYTQGRISGKNLRYSSGFVGFLGGVIENSYSATKFIDVPEYPQIFGLVGSLDTNIDENEACKYSYWDIDISKTTSSEACKYGGLTTYVMKRKSTYINYWDPEIWDFEVLLNYPFLKMHDDSHN